MSPYEYGAKVIRWVDGDTVDLRVDLGFHMFAETRFRLYGVDTPERGQTNHAEATALCNALAPAGADVLIQSHKDADKYGRWLAVVTPAAANVSVNDGLLTAGLAVPYFGGTKGISP